MQSSQTCSNEEVGYDRPSVGSPAAVASILSMANRTGVTRTRPRKRTVLCLSPQRSDRPGAPDLGLW